jgi:hypothetical protein
VFANVGPYIYDVKISDFAKSSIYIYDISRLRVKIKIRFLQYEIQKGKCVFVSVCVRACVSARRTQQGTGQKTGQKYERMKLPTAVLLGVCSFVAGLEFIDD